MKNKVYTLHELALLTGATLVGDPYVTISNVETLELATPTDASFLSSFRYEQAMLNSSAGVVFVSEETVLPPNRNFLISASPSLSFQKCVEAFFCSDSDATGFEGIHPSAVIHPTAKVHENVQIGPYAVIDKYATIQAGTEIGAGSIIGPHVSIGKECLIHPRVTIASRTVIGDRVILQSGCVIGACGFGYVTDKEGKHTKLSQVGNVAIGDDVEIGANTTIDRARFKTTWIHQGSKIDNLVQIAHGVSVGRHNIIVAQTGIAGSTKIGDYVVLAGQVAIAGHLKIAPYTTVTALSGVSKSITKPGKYGGIPAQPLDDYNRTAVHLRKIATYAAKIKHLELQVSHAYVSGK